MTNYPTATTDAIGEGFRNRVITKELSLEFIEHATEYDVDEIDAALQNVCERLERSYHLVAEVREAEQYGQTVYILCVIPARGADREAVSRGAQVAYHWLSEGEVRPEDSDHD